MTEYVSVGATTPGTAAELTLDRAKANVARVIGNESDPTTLGHATDALRAAVGEWNRRHQFDANALVSASVAVTEGTSAYDLPSNFLHMYTVRLGDRPLSFLRRRLYDRATWDQDQPGYATHYTLFGSGNSGQIVILPDPSTDETMTLRYYAGIVMPTEGGSGFGLPDRFVWGMIFKAKALLVMDRNAEDPRIGVWLREAEMAFRQARADDVDHPDEDLRMVSQMEHRRRTFPESHAYHFLEE